MPEDDGAPDGHGESVGAALARMRRSSGLTGAKLAALVGMSQPKISRIERGIGSLDAGDVGTLARSLGADETTTRSLMERAERTHDRMTEWGPAVVGLAGGQTRIGDWEYSAKIMRTFEPALVPGLLQTSGYAKAVFQAYVRVTPGVAGHPAEQAVLAAVSARVRRQEVLADRSKKFRMIVAESVLRYQICPVADMLAQVGHVREVAAQSNVEIGAIADGTSVGIPPVHGFTIFDESLVIIDLYNTGLISRGRGDLATYRTVFDILADQATDIEPLLAKYETMYLDQLRNPPPEI
jgi:transcriptional regulator with XRE-family HTH domain